MRPERRTALMRTCLALILSSLVASGCGPLDVINGLSRSGSYERLAGRAYGNDDRQRLDVYLPRGRQGAAPLVVFFYGGGWRSGSREDYAFVAAALTEEGYAVVIPDYRLYPQVAFPAFVEDGAAAVGWAVENLAMADVAVDRLVIVGHSAGAHIGALLVLDPGYLAAEGIDRSLLAAFAGLSGPYDFLPVGDGYLSGVFPRNVREESQPVRFASCPAPPILLIHGLADETVSPENSRTLAQRLSDCATNVTVRLYKGVGHGRVVAALAPLLAFLAQTRDDLFLFLESVLPAGP